MSYMSKANFLQGILKMLQFLVKFVKQMLQKRDHNGSKTYKSLFVHNPYHPLSAIKDIVSFSLVFYC